MIFTLIFLIVPNDHRRIIIAKKFEHTFITLVFETGLLLYMQLLIHDMIMEPIDLLGLA